MAKIFLAYKFDEQAAAAQLAELLEKEGHSVWWDAALQAGQDFGKEIEGQLRTSELAVVLWSKGSVGSPWVLAEAAFALRQQKLIPFVVDDARVPVPFNVLQTSRLYAGDGKIDPNVVWQINKALDDRSASTRPPSDFETDGDRAQYVFICHANRDKSRLKPVVESLLSEGIRVFVDRPADMSLSIDWAEKGLLRYIATYEDYALAINRNLLGAGCILVFWSEASISMDGDRGIFWDEVQYGRSSGKLVSAMVDDVIGGPNKLPPGQGIGRAQIVDFTTEDSLTKNMPWLLHDIRQLFKNGPTPLSQVGKGN